MVLFTTQRKAVLLSTNGSTTVYFKCWQGKPKETSFFVVTRSPFKTADDSPLQVRVDSNVVMEITALGKDFGGRQRYVAVQHADADVLDLISQMAVARDRLVVDVSGTIELLSAADASYAFARFRAACGFRQF